MIEPEERVVERCPSDNLDFQPVSEGGGGGGVRSVRLNWIVEYTAGVQRIGQCGEKNPTHLVSEEFEKCCECERRDTVISFSKPETDVKFTEAQWKPGAVWRKGGFQQLSLDKWSFRCLSGTYLEMLSRELHFWDWIEFRISVRAGNVKWESIEHINIQTICKATWLDKLIKRVGRQKTDPRMESWKMNLDHYTSQHLQNLPWNGSQA